MTAIAGESTIPDTSAARIPRAAFFALFVLMLANVFNLLDRQIMSILAQSIKEDLQLDDADLGFLLGTAFAVFYSVVGIAMGRISDFVSRRKLMAFGMALWSVMTAMGGAASSFMMLSAARFGVGVGEAVANPCSHSLLSDIFPPRHRALAIGTYLAGNFIGGTLALILGGVFLQYWPDFCAVVPLASACSLPGWKAALVAVGLPGLLVALLVLLIREPSRPLPENQSTVRLVVREIASALPPLTLVRIHQLGGRRALIRNLVLACAIIAVAWLLVRVTGDLAQWAAFGLGTYAVVTWGQVQSHADKPLFSVTYGDRTFVLSVTATALIACISGVFSVWAAPLAMRTFKLSPTEIGLWLGIAHTAGAIIGVVAGGWLTDRWKARDLRAPLGMTAVTLLGTIPSVLLMITATTVEMFFVGYFFQSLFASLWSGGIAALVQDLVLPRMRGAAAASYSLVAIVVASSIGPYWTGKVSEMTGSLNAGLFSILVLVPVAALVLWLAARRLPAETPERRRAIAEAAGEPGR